VARRLERLQELKLQIEESWSSGAEADTVQHQNTSVETFQADLADPVQRAALLSYVDLNEIDIDVVVNAAATATLGEFAHADIVQQAEMLELNCVAPLQLIRHLGGPMIRRGRGVIINVASIGAFQPAPYMAVYAATKAFILNYTLALAEEFSETGVQVLAHCPGPTRTEFHLVVGLPEDMSPLPEMTPDDTVREALRALDKNKRLIIPGFINRRLVAVGRLLPLDRSAKAAKKMLLSRWRPPSP
jgi:hypothetical protein